VVLQLLIILAQRVTFVWKEQQPRQRLAVILIYLLICIRHYLTLKEHQHFEGVELLLDMILFWVPGIKVVGQMKLMILDSKLLMTPQDFGRRDISSL